MRAYEMRYVPGQIHTVRLRGGSSIVAMEGALRLRSRDASLSWLLDAAPTHDLRLGEGAQYRLPCDAIVEICAEGKRAAVGAIEPASTGLARCSAWIARVMSAMRPGQWRSAGAPLASRRAR